MWAPSSRSFASCVSARLPRSSTPPLRYPTSPRFPRSATCAEVYAWLRGCLELESLDDQWTLTLPAALARLEGGLQPTDETLEELDLCGATIFVQDEAA